MRRYPNYIKEVRGIGLIQGLVLRDDITLTAQFFVNAALQQQLLVVPAGPQVIRMVPPLVIKEREIRYLLRKLDATFRGIDD
jgi:acetylornithine aminotransferase